MQDRIELLKPPDAVLDYQSQIFNEMGVVQRKAMRKAGRFMLYPSVSLDFSDGPYTNYYVQLNPGYAITDFWEINFVYAPLVFSNPRSVVNFVESLTLVSGRKAQISYDKLSRLMGFEILWAPMYGKDSLGSRNLIRSDTFLKTGMSWLTYESGSAGYRFFVGFGKTYFLSPNMGFRAAIVSNLMQTILDNQKKMTFQASFEMGMNFYF